MTSLVVVSIGVVVVVGDRADSVLFFVIVTFTLDGGRSRNDDGNCSGRESASVSAVLLLLVRKKEVFRCSSSSSIVMADKRLSASSSSMTRSSASGDSPGLCCFRDRRRCTGDSPGLGIVRLDAAAPLLCLDNDGNGVFGFDSRFWFGAVGGRGVVFVIFDLMYWRLASLLFTAAVDVLEKLSE